MIRFTPKGAVSTPDTLQVRVGPEPAGALQAGAPTPSRRLTTGEVVANVAHFTHGLDTPRTRPCSRLVLSAVENTGSDLVAAVGEIRALGITHVVVHGAAPPELNAAADVRVRRCEQPSDVPTSSQPVVVVVPLTVAGLSNGPGVIDALDPARVQRLVFSWPFPEVPVHPIGATLKGVASLREHATRRGIPSSLAGLPPCLAPNERDARTRNRFYVDADHQTTEALLFWPDIVQFLKPDACRGCARTAVCDGVAARWMELGVVSAVHPFPH